MDAFLPFLIMVGGLALVLGLCTWLAVVSRRRGVAGGGLRGAMAAYDEAFHGTAADSYYEIQVEADRQTPMPSPGDPWRLRLRLRRHS
ncbi:hypothetical protein [Streptomyces sp. NPDC002845]